MIKREVQRLNTFFRPYFSFYLAGPILRYRTPELFRTGSFNASQYEQTTSRFHRGDYASLNIIFVYRMQKNFTYWRDNHHRLRLNYSYEPGGMAMEPWASVQAQRDKEDGAIITSSSVAGLGIRLHYGTPNILHEVGHFLGLPHLEDPCNLMNSKYKHE